MRNKEVFKMYKGKMCMKHVATFYTPITKSEIGYRLFTGQLDNSEAHKKATSDINEKIQEVLCDNLAVDVLQVETRIMFGEPMEE